MSDVLTFFRQEDPHFKEVPDNELTDFIVKEYPEFLQDSDFAKRVSLTEQLARVRKEAATGDAIESGLGTTESIVAGGRLDNLAKGLGKVGNYTGRVGKGFGQDLSEGRFGGGDPLHNTMQALAGNTAAPAPPTGMPSRLVTGVGEGVGKMVPAMIGTAYGVPPAISYGTTFGTEGYEETGDPIEGIKQGAVGAALGPVGELGGAGGALLAGRLGSKLPQAMETTALKVGEEVGAQALMNTLLTASQAPEMIEKAQADPEAFRNELVDNIALNIAFRAPHLKQAAHEIAADAFQRYKGDPAFTEQMDLAIRNRMTGRGTMEEGKHQEAYSLPQADRPNEMEVSLRGGRFSRTPEPEPPKPILDLDIPNFVDVRQPAAKRQAEGGKLESSGEDYWGQEAKPGFAQTAEDRIAGRQPQPPERGREIVRGERQPQPLKDSSQLVEEKLGQRDRLAAVEAMGEESSATSPEQINDLTGQSREKAGLEAGEQLIFDNVWEQKVKESLAGPFAAQPGRPSEASSPVGMERPADTPKGIIDHLESLKSDNNGRVHVFGLIPAAWNALVGSVQSAVRAGKALPQAINDAIGFFRQSYADLQDTAARLKTYSKGRGVMGDAARTKDSADTIAAGQARRQANGVRQEIQRVFGGESKMASQAVTAVVEAGGSRAKLQGFLAQAAGRDRRAELIASYAINNLHRLAPIAARVKALHDAQHAAELASGIDSEYRSDYIKHAYDPRAIESIKGTGKFFTSAGGSSGSSAFRKMRAFDTLFDAVQNGYGKAIKTWDAPALLESRIRDGGQKIADKAWFNSFRTVADPASGDPVIADLKPQYDSAGKVVGHVAPEGYETIMLTGQQGVAVHKGYAGIFKALTGGSALDNHVLTRGLVKAEAIIKHGLLAVDTFHAFRVGFNQIFLSGNPAKFWSYNKGLSLLEYNDVDLARAVSNGTITQPMADYARANRTKAELLQANGLNVGRLQDALRAEVVKKIPIAGDFNTWVFSKLTRGAMMEGAISEYDRLRRAGIMPGDAAKQVAQDINIKFGSLGRQDVFRGDRTLQDISRLVLLAPQWFEGLVRSEGQGAWQLLKAPVSKAPVGTLGKTLGTGLVASFIATQVLNLITRNQFTFQNKEEGHKLDAYIPSWSGGQGYFVSPMAVVAEVTHDLIRFTGSKDHNIFDAFSHLLGNKLSPLARSEETLRTGKNWAQQKIVGLWPRVKEAGKALIPIPIPASGAVSDKPGATQKQLMASIGIKTEFAPTAYQQVKDRAVKFAEAKGRARPAEVTFKADDPNRNLRQALAAKDDRAAMAAIDKLAENHPRYKIPSNFRQAMQSPFTGSSTMEPAFYRSLDEEGKRLYRQAKEERAALLGQFSAVWKKWLASHQKPNPN